MCAYEDEEGRGIYPSVRLTRHPVGPIAAVEKRDTKQRAKTKRAPKGNNHNHHNHNNKLNKKQTSAGYKKH